MPFRFWRRRHADLELEREVASHLHHLTEEYVGQGHSREEAQRMARHDFGGVEQIKEDCRDQRAWAWSTGFFQDVVFGIRMLRRTPIVTAAAVLSLALGIGANAAVVSLMDVVLWRNLPVPDPRELSLVHWTGQGHNRELTDGAAGSVHPDGATRVADFFPDRAFTELRKRVTGYASVAAFNFTQQVSTSYSGRPAVGQERPVSGSFFETLRVNAKQGRTLTDADDHYASPPAVVVSHRFWVQSLASDEGAIGRTITINKKPRTIVGVLPREFYGLNPGDSTDIYTPMHHASWLEDRKDKDPLGNDRFWGTSMLLRRNAGVSAAQITPLADAAFRSTWTKVPSNPANTPRVRLDDGNRGVGMLRREFRKPLLVLGGLVTLLLVIACINIANLLLARANARQREVVTRVALGCAPARLMRQFLTESALLALLGGVASLGVAYFAANFLGSFVVSFDSAPIAVSPDARILMTAAAITGFTLLLFGVFPAWRTSLMAERSVASLRLHASSSAGSGYESRKAARTGRALVLAQMAISVVLVLAAVIFTRNLLGIQSSDPGFDRRNLILFNIRPGTSGYEKERLTQLYRNVEEYLSRVPGVRSVGLASIRPMNVGGWWEQVRLPGQAENIEVSVNGITAGYLPLYDVPLLAGRNLSLADVDTEAKVAVISEDLAVRLGGGVAVLGRTVEFGDGPPGGEPPHFQVVGIAAPLAATSLKDRPSTMWVPFPKQAKEATVVLRTEAVPQLVMRGVQQAMLELDRDLPLVDVMTMEQQIAKGLQQERMFATLCTAFGTLALTLAVIGLYGVIAYSVSRRSGEIGVRLALGAVPKDVMAMILREGLGLAVLGIMVAAPVVWFSARYLETELHQMKALEPTSVALSLTIMVAAVVAAVLIPALRASTIQPAHTLRHE